MFRFLGRKPSRSPIRFDVLVAIEPDEGGFHAYCPGLPGLHVDGKTEDEALRNAVDAAQAYIDSLLKHGEPIPVGPHVNVTQGESYEPERIPIGAFMRHVTLQWPSHLTSGVS